MNTQTGQLGLCNEINTRLIYKMVALTPETASKTYDFGWLVLFFLFLFLSCIEKDKRKELKKCLEVTVQNSSLNE